MESNQEWENTRDERAEVFGVKKGINQILKCGAVTWILLLVIWQIGSLFYTDDFLPGPATTFAGAGVLIEDGTLATDISVSLQRVLRGWLLGVQLQESRMGVGSTLKFLPFCAGDRIYHAVSDVVWSGRKF